MSLKLPLLGFLLIPLAVSPVLLDQFTVAKWIALHGLTLLCLVVLLAKKHPLKIPKLGGKSLWFFLLVTLYLLSALVNWPGNYFKPFLDWGCFSILVLLVYTTYSDEERFLQGLYPVNFVATILVITLGAFQAMGVAVLGALAYNGFSSSTFGYQNMTAEFLGISLLVQLSFFRRARGGWFWLSLVLLIATFGHLYLLASRAALLAAALAIPFLILSTQRRAKPWLFSCGVLILVMGSIAIFPRLFSPSNPHGSELAGIKQKNTQIRLVRWMNTLYMAADNPLGVGPGNYEFGYLPYSDRFQMDPESSETMIVRSPHNGYLEAMAENGIFFVVVLCLLIILGLKSLFQWRGGELKGLVFSLFVFLLVDALFAFPMENAFPFYVAAIGLGIFLRLSVKTSLAVPRWAMGLSLLVLVALGSAHGISKFIEGLVASRHDVVSFGCRIFPDNWRLCARKAEMEIARGEFLGATHTTRSMLRRSPHNFVAVRLQFQAHQSSGNGKESCRWAKRYDALFKRMSTLRSHLEKACGSEPIG